MKILLDNGANPDLPDKDGITAHEYVQNCIHNREEICSRSDEAGIGFGLSDLRKIKNLLLEHKCSSKYDSPSNHSSQSSNSHWNIGFVFQ